MSVNVFLRLHLSASMFSLFIYGFRMHASMYVCKYGFQPERSGNLVLMVHYCGRNYEINGRTMQ